MDTRQVLALMVHPTVVKVFDGSATDTGRPYYVHKTIWWIVTS
jgi:hypothetical protein